MGKIKAYKCDGVLVPVKDVKIVNAYQCPWTKRIFSTKASYVNYLAKLRADRTFKRIRNRRQNALFEEFIMQPDLESIVKWIELHPEFFFDRMIAHGRAGWGNRRAKFRDDFWIKIHSIELTYSHLLSNSHSCPRGGVTCWSSWESKDGRPRGYPGWGGYIKFQLSHDISGSDVFNTRIGINTGTGGGSGGNIYEYDLKMFADDWPGMKMMRFMNNEKYHNMKYQMQYAVKA